MCNDRRRQTGRATALCMTASAFPFPNEDESSSPSSSPTSPSTPSPQEVSLLSTFFPITPTPSPTSIAVDYAILGYSPSYRSTFDLNGGSAVETIMSLFKAGGIDLTVAIDESDAKVMNGQANLFGNNGAVVIAIDSYVRSRVSNLQAEEAPRVSSMFINGTSMPSFVDPSETGVTALNNYNPYGTEYLESIQGPLPIVDAIKSLRDNGFSDGDIVTILTLNPALAFEPSEYVRFEAEGVLALLIDKLEMRKYDARKIIRSNPAVLMRGGAKNARQIVYFLSHAGVSQKWLKNNKPFLADMIGREGKTLLKTVLFLVEEESVQIPWDKLAQVIKNLSFSLILSTFVSNPNESEVTSAYENLQGVCTALKQSKYGAIDVSKVAVVYPEVLVMENGSIKIAKCLDVLVKTVGVDSDDVKKVVERYPSLLGTPLSEILVARNFLVDIEVQELGKVVKAFPNILTIQRHQMRRVAYFLENIGVVNVGRFVTRIPPILSYDVDKELVPRWEILKAEGMGAFDLTRFPAFFSYPIQRIKMRYGFLRHAGINSRGLTIDDVLRGGDRDFAMMVGLDVEDYRNYEMLVEQGRRDGNRGKRRSGKRRRKPDK